uniref:Uncharacterized protein n=1 Tax=Brassica campestris TaxID=3711 RepID=M4F4S2_BRACM
MGYSLATSGDLLFTGSDSKNIRVWKNHIEFSTLKSKAVWLKLWFLQQTRYSPDIETGRSVFGKSCLKTRAFSVWQVNQNGSRLRQDFRVTIGGKELKSAQGLYFDDKPRSQSQASHRIASGVTVWYSFVACHMSSSCGYANECLKVFASYSSCFSVLSLDIFCKLKGKIIG